MGGVRRDTVSLAGPVLGEVRALAAPSAQSLVGGTLVGGRYRLHGIVGRGGMGVVYSARDASTGRRVALKFMAWGGESERADREGRFLTEVVGATAVTHPHVVDVLDVGVHAGEPYLVMEFLEGEALDERLARLGVLAPAEAVAIALAVIGALGALHAAGIVHRDVKPSNIHLVERNGTIVPKLLDFGVARVLADSRVTRTGAVLGTPAYMSPEQAAGGAAGPASDVWSAGVVLYECLAGAPPYRSFEPAVLATLVLAGRVLPLHQSHPHLPAALCAVVERALVRDLAQRYPDMASFGAALQAAQRGEPAPHRADASQGGSAADAPTELRGTDGPTRVSTSALVPAGLVCLAALACGGFLWWRVGARGQVPELRDAPDVSAPAQAAVEETSTRPVVERLAPPRPTAKLPATRRSAPKPIAAQGAAPPRAALPPAAPPRTAPPPPAPPPADTPAVPAAALPFGLETRWE